ncbi:MAG: hypothetical protein LBG57_05355 [Treponema sp.]|jgi:hypothetical protein|nr:hypothetical protein [Treponema sp.]
MFDKKHSDETRRKMSEAAKRRRAGEKQAGSVTGCYRRLMAAIVAQAVKNRAAWFLESEPGKSYCAVAGIKSPGLKDRR